MTSPLESNQRLSVMVKVREMNSLINDVSAQACAVFTVSATVCPSVALVFHLAVLIPDVTAAVMALPQARASTHKTRSCKELRFYEYTSAHQALDE